MARTTLKRLMAAHLLAAFAALGVVFDDSASATTFSITEDSPEAAPGGDFDGSDIIEAFGNPPPQVDGALLGLGPDDELDAHSFGRDYIFPVGPFNVSFLTYSVSRGTQGAGGPVTNQVNGNGAAGDKFRVIVLPAGLTLGPAVLSDAPVHNLTPKDAGFESELDALSDPPSAKETVFFSVDPATAAGQPYGPSDIMYVAQPGVDTPVLYLSAAAMGLGPDDNVDAIAVRDTGQRGVADANDVVHISLDAQSPTRAIFFPGGGDGVLQVLPGPLQVAIEPGRLDIGTGPLEELDAMTASDPGLEFGAPANQLMLLGGDEIGGFRADDIQPLGIGSRSALMSATRFGGQTTSALINAPLDGGPPEIFVEGDLVDGAPYFFGSFFVEAVLNEDDEIAVVASKDVGGEPMSGVLVGTDLQNLWPAIPPGDASLTHPDLTLTDIPPFESSPAYSNGTVASAVVFDRFRRGMRFVSRDGVVRELLDGPDTPAGFGVDQAFNYTWPSIVHVGNQTRSYFKVEGQAANGSFASSVMRMTEGVFERIVGTGSEVEGDTVDEIDTFRAYEKGVLAIARTAGVSKLIHYDRAAGTLRRIRGVPYDEYYLLCSRLSRQGRLWVKAHGFNRNSVYYKNLRASEAIRRIIGTGEGVPNHPGWTVDFIDNVNSRGEEAVITVGASNPAEGEGFYALACSGSGSCRTLLKTGDEVMRDARSLLVQYLRSYDGATGGIAQGRNAGFNERGDFFSTVQTPEGPAAVRSRWDHLADRDGDGSPFPIDLAPDDPRLARLIDPVTGRSVELEIEDPPGARFVGATTRRVPSLLDGSTFEHGVLDFEIHGVTPGGSATLIARYDGQSLGGTLWKKIQQGASGEEAVAMPGAERIGDDTYRVTVVDGSEFDEDGRVDGVIVDPSGPAREALSSLDSDGDTIPDEVDNCLERPNAFQLDTDRDGYGNVCDADYTQDGLVAGTDFTAFIDYFGGTDPTADHTGDGIVAGSDFVVFVELFGERPGPSGLACAGSTPCTAP